MKFGIDCASPATNTSGLKASHVEFVCRYLSPPGNTKNLTKTEAVAIQRSGLGLVVIWEENGDEPLSGTNAGIRDARLAAAEAAELGLPAAMPIYFAFDRDPSALGAPQWSGIEGYFKGVASVLGVHRVGAYGGYALIKRLFDKKLVRYGWQTYGWSGGQWDARAQLRQYLNAQTVAGISVDFDHATAEDYGQAHPPKVWKKPVAAHMAWTDKHGNHRAGAFRGPVWFKLRHRRAWWHGAVTSTPLHKK